MEMIGVARFSYAFQILAAQRNTPSAARRLNGFGRISRRDDPSRFAAASASQRRSPVMSRTIATPGSGWSRAQEIAGTKSAASPPNPKSLTAPCAAIVTMEERRAPGILKTASGSARHWSRNALLCASSPGMSTLLSMAPAASACGSSPCRLPSSISLNTARRR